MKFFYYCIEGSFNDLIKEKAHNSIIYSLQNNTDFFNNKAGYEVDDPH